MNKINDYLEKHFVEIENLRSSGKIVWNAVAREIFQQTGEQIYKEQLRHRFARLRKRADKIIQEGFILDIEDFKKSQEKDFEFKENINQGTAEIKFTADHTPSEEEIIEWFKIDLKKYRINQIYHKTHPSGKYSITVSLLALKGAESGNYEEKFEKFVEEYNKKILSGKHQAQFKQEENVPKGLYICSLSDLHIGNFQREDYLERIKELVEYGFSSAKDNNIERVIILNTGDIIHSDGSQNKTWKGTQLHSAQSYEDSFTAGLDLICTLIDSAQSFFPNVTFVNVRGNHSFDTEYCMGEGLRKIYRNSPNVEILNSKDTRIYYAWRNQGYCFTHGDRGIERLPLIFATEGREVFNKTTNHHILLGHLHTSKSKQFVDTTGEFAGLEVRVLGSPTTNDTWHKQESFVGNKKSIVTLFYTEDEGRYGEFNYRI